MKRLVFAFAALCAAPFAAFAQQPSANTVYAGPSNGSPAPAQFRALVSSDLPGSVNSQSANYTIAATDCNGLVVETGAFKTITLPASLTGFPSNCPIRIVNGSSTRAQALAGFPASLPSGCGGACLWPNQGITVAIASGSWIVVAAPGRWKVTSAPTINVSTSGSDNNDGLAAGAPLQHIQTALNTVQSAIDFGPNLTTNATIQLATGTYSECLTWFGPQVGTEDVTIQGNVGSPTSYVISCSGNHAVQTKDGGATLTLVGLEVSATSSGFSAVLADAASALDLNTVVLTSVSGNDIFSYRSGSQITIVGPVTAASSTTNFYQAALGGKIYINGNVTINNGVTITNFATAGDQGEVYQSGSNTVTNNGTVTNMCSISLLGVVNRNGVTFPGTVCTPSTGGQLN